MNSKECDGRYYWTSPSWKYERTGLYHQYGTYDGSTTGTPWCEWQYNKNTGYGDWGCGDSIFCEAFSNNKCSYFDVNYSEVIYENDNFQVDCSGATRNSSTRYYHYCCNTDDCNYEDIVSARRDDCVENTDYGEIISTFSQCRYGKEFLATEYYCEPLMDEITCDIILEIISHLIGCYCKMYGSLYDYVSVETQIYMEQLIENFPLRVLNVDFEEWNSVLGCDINLSCDISTGLITNNGESSVSGCDPECDDDYICLSNGKCQLKTSDTICSTNDDCLVDGNNFECLINNGICYYSECNVDNDCSEYDDSFECNPEKGEKNGNQFIYGLCQDTNTDHGTIYHLYVFLPLACIFISFLI